MDPLPPTVEAFEKLERLGAGGIEAGLQRIAQEVEAIVPECVGLSLSLVEDDITLTLAASELQLLPLDAMQYLDGGPCVDSVDHNRVVEVDEIQADNEERWSMFARATAAHGVMSSLSIPLLDGTQVLGGVNLYASRPDAFEGHVEALAHVVGAWAPGAVRDADLTFSTRLRAAQAPGTLADHSDIDTAVALIATSQDVNATVAAQRLRDAAARAGISEAAVARTVLYILVP